MPKAPKKQSKKVKETKVETNVSLTDLEEENLALKKELNKLQKAVDEKLDENQTKGSRWRSFFAGFFAILAVISLVLFNVSYWTNKTIINDQQFVKTVAPIIKDQDVKKTLQKEISKQIFTKINVEQELKNALPDNLDFIAAPFAAQVQDFVTGKIGEALNSPQVEQAWATVLDTVHTQLIAYIQNPNNDGKITVDEVYNKVGDQLQNSQVGFLFGKNLPASIGSVTIKEVTWLPKARQAIDVLQQLTQALAVSTVAFAALALGLSRRRLSMTVKLMAFSLFGMLITLGALKFGSYEVGANVASQYQAAAVAVYNTITTHLAAQTKGIAALLGSDPRALQIK